MLPAGSESFTYFILTEFQLWLLLPMGISVREEAQRIVCIPSRHLSVLCASVHCRHEVRGTSIHALLHQTFPHLHPANQMSLVLRFTQTEDGSGSRDWRGSWPSSETLASEPDTQPLRNESRKGQGQCWAQARVTLMPRLPASQQP